jgi:hypothetical protein
MEAGLNASTNKSMYAANLPLCLSHAAKRPMGMFVMV